MNQKQVILQTSQHIKEKFTGESTGHDWWHIYRVWKMAIYIAKKEQANIFVVELGALLHDIADFKFHNGDETVGPRAAREWLEGLQVEDSIINQVVHIVANVSFKGAGVEEKMQSLEGKIVQDADRLDAIGAVGIARVFAYGGSKNREIYNPEKKITNHITFEEYKNSNSSGVNHFYEKLLLLKDRMNTLTGKEIAKGRHEFMKIYLQRFYKEWEGKV